MIDQLMQWPVGEHFASTVWLALECLDVDAGDVSRDEFHDLADARLRGIDLECARAARQRHSGVDHRPWAGHRGTIPAGEVDYTAGAFEK